MFSNGQKPVLKSEKPFYERMMVVIGSPGSVVFHSIFFVGIFSLRFFGVHLDEILLILTTLVSLEAIYMAIFIQMAVNKTNRSLQEVEEDIEEIQEDVGEIQEDVGEIQEDVGEIQEDVGELQEDVGEIQKDFEDEQGEVLEGAAKESEEQTEVRASNNLKTRALEAVESQLAKLLSEVQKLKRP